MKIKENEASKLSVKIPYYYLKKKKILEKYAKVRVYFSKQTISSAGRACKLLTWNLKKSWREIWICIYTALMWWNYENVFEILWNYFKKATYFIVYVNSPNLYKCMEFLETYISH